jgi:hypothetical protein
MPNTNATFNDDIIRDLARTEHKPEEAPINIACELLCRLEPSPASDSLCMRSLAGNPFEEARAIASTAQARVKGLSPLQA